jgi:hypothetical protein
LIKTRKIQKEETNMGKKKKRTRNDAFIEGPIQIWEIAAF